MSRHISNYINCTLKDKEDLASPRALMRGTKLKKAAFFQKNVLEKLRSDGGPVEEERLALADLYY